MTKKEIISRVEAGESLMYNFGIRKDFQYIGGKLITKSQYDAAIKHFGDRLEFRADFNGLTKHYYSLKK